MREIKSESEVDRVGVRGASGRYKTEKEDKDPPSEKMVESCCAWLKAHVLPRNRLMPGHGSYYYKHAVEDWRRRNGEEDPYTQNGAFIVAALRCGFRARQASPGSPNCIFNFVESRDTKDYGIR